MSTTVNNKKGFTLIELVIVLAIAALILAGILLAVSGAQKSRRDSQRKNDLGRVLANIETISSNIGGSPPAAFPAAAITGMTDPLNGIAYTTAAIVTPTTTVPAGILYTPGGGTATDCAGQALGAKQFKVQMGSEGVGTLCLDDH